MADKIPFNQLPPEVQKKFGPDSWGALGAETQSKILNLFADGLTKAKNRGSKLDTSDKVDFENDELGTLSDIASARQRDADVVMAGYKQLIKEGQFFATDGPFLKGLGEVVRKQNEMFAQPKLGAEAYMTLSKNVNQFNKLTGEAFNKTGNFTAKLSEQAGLLSKLGLGYGNFTENLETAIYDMGMNQKGVEDFNMSIKKLADGLDMLPDRVSRNFRQVAANLMYDSATIKQEYAKLETLAQKTGLSSTALADQFGSRMDTISGASSAASSLNAMLGRNAFSATELLGMTESERAEAIREAVQGDSNLMGDITAGGAQGKFAMISVAEALGMSRKDARRFITTGEKGSVKAAMEKEIGAATGTTDGLTTSTLIENFKTPAKDLGLALDRLRNQFEMTLDPNRVALLQNRSVMMERAGRGEFRGLEMAGRISRVGLLEGKTSQAQYAEISKDPAALAMFEELLKREQLGTAARGSTGSIARLLTGTEQERAAGFARARRMVKAPVRLDEELRDAGAVNPAIISALVRLGSANKYGGRVMFRAAMEKLRSGGDITKEDLASYQQRANKLNTEVGKASSFISDKANNLDSDFGGLDESVLKDNLESSDFEAFKRRREGSAAQKKLEQERIDQEVEGLEKLNSASGIESASVSTTGGDTQITIVMGDSGFTIKGLKKAEKKIQILEARQTAVENTVRGR